MKQPNEYWLKYMLLFSGMNLEQISEIASLYNFPAPSVTYLRALRDKLNESKPSPFRITSSSTRSWARGQRLLSMATDEPSATKARDLLGNNICRPVIEALLISGMGTKEVSEYTGAITGVKVSKRCVGMYRHYFWNRDLLSVSEWYSFLDDYPRGDLLKGCFDQGPDYALWKLGYRVEISKDEVIRGLLHESTMRYFETSREENSKDTAMMAKLWSEQVFKSVEMMDRTGDAVKQVLTELKDLAIKLGRREISSIQDLED